MDPSVVSTSKMMRMPINMMIRGLVSKPLSRLGGSLFRVGGENGDDAPDDV
jgi:hypothetical protein